MFEKEAMGPQPRLKKTEVREDDMRVVVHLYPGEESSFAVIEHADGGEEKTEFGGPEPDDDEESDAGPLEADKDDKSAESEQAKPAEAGEAAAPSEGADEQAPVESDAVEGDETREESDGLPAGLPPLPDKPVVDGDDCSDEGEPSDDGDAAPAEDGDKSK